MYLVQSMKIRIRLEYKDFFRKKEGSKQKRGQRVFGSWGGLQERREPYKNKKPLKLLRGFSENLNVKSFLDGNGLKFGFSGYGLFHRYWIGQK